MDWEKLEERRSAVGTDVVIDMITLRNMHTELYPKDRARYMAQALDLLPQSVRANEDEVKYKAAYWKRKQEGKDPGPEPTPLLLYFDPKTQLIAEELELIVEHLTPLEAMEVYEASSSALSHDIVRRKALEAPDDLSLRQCVSVLRGSGCVSRPATEEELAYPEKIADLIRVRARHASRENIADALAVAIQLPRDKAIVSILEVQIARHIRQITRDIPDQTNASNPHIAWFLSLAETVTGCSRVLNALYRAVVRVVVRAIPKCEVEAHLRSFPRPAMYEALDYLASLLEERFVSKPWCMSRPPTEEELAISELSSTHPDRERQLRLSFPQTDVPFEVTLKSREVVMA